MSLLGQLLLVLVLVAAAAALVVAAAALLANVGKVGGLAPSLNGDVGDVVGGEVPLGLRNVKPDGCCAAGCCGCGCGCAGGVNLKADVLCVLVGCCAGAFDGAFHMNP